MTRKENTREVLLREFNEIYSSGKIGLFSEPIKKKIRICLALQNKFYWRLSRGVEESDDYMIQLKAEIEKLKNDAFRLWIAEKKQ